MDNKFYDKHSEAQHFSYANNVGKSLASNAHMSSNHNSYVSNSIPHNSNYNSNYNSNFNPNTTSTHSSSYNANSLSTQQRQHPSEATNHNHSTNHLPNHSNYPPNHINHDEKISHQSYQSQYPPHPNHSTTHNSQQDEKLQPKKIVQPSNIQSNLSTQNQQQNEKNPEKNSNQPTSTSTSSALTSIPFPPAITEPMPTRSKYKTYILADAVFEVEQRYEIKEIVGHGAYGIVCSARDLKTNQMVAVKKIENIFEHRSLAKRTLRELKLVRYFYHENIMGLERVMRPHSTNFNNVYLVSELMETDLACVIRSPQELTDEHCQFFIYQVLRGLKYIHSANVVHRDLKPRNLLVNSNCDLKICDFGLARVDDPDNADRCVMSHYVATRWYRAPEVILSRKRYTKAVDMWSVGCILAELLGRKPLFPGRDSFHQITLIVSILGTPTNVSGRKSRDYVSSLPKKPKIPFTKVFPKATPLACDLLDKLLQFEPENRYTVEQALRHPYLEELHCEEDEPICDNFDPQDFYFEYLRTTKEDLRVLIHQEIVNNYKEDDYECKDPTPVDTSLHLPKVMPRGKRRRRKSY